MSLILVEMDRSFCLEQPIQLLRDVLQLAVGIRRKTKDAHKEPKISANEAPINPISHARPLRVKFGCRSPNLAWSRAGSLGGRA